MMGCKYGFCMGQVKHKSILQCQYQDALKASLKRAKNNKIQAILFRYSPPKNPIFAPFKKV